MTQTQITQADRLAAWEHRPSCYKVDDYTNWMAGRYDFVAAIIKGFAAHRTNRTDATPVAWMPDFQAETDQWMDACFGSTIKADTLERDDRFIEECLELVQTNPSFTADRAHALVNYVFSRPVGEPFQETGGVMVTLAARSNPAGISIKDAAETELARIWTKVEAIRAKQATKPTGSALPIAVTHPPATDVAALVEAAEPFISFTKCHINDEGWNGPMKTTRIVDWFGPSDFRNLSAALAPFTKGQNDE